jgi:UDP-N-acetylmuramoyl-L-alanyl-D-glutamate--2,6-diaminopimelate ligase
MRRVDGCQFDVAGFTQLGTDHLDFHGSEDAYFKAKLSLFQPDHSHAAVVTVDDDGGRRVAELAGVPVTTVGSSPTSPGTATAPAPLWTIADVRERINGGYRFALKGPGGVTRACEVAMMGRFNVANAAVAQLMLQKAGLDAAAAARGIAGCRGVPGRMERVGPRDVALVVDYAHTTDALARAIDAVRPESVGRVIVVFGCGGDRDPTKRAAMGAAAARGADVVVITDDNPRSEDPATIREAVLEGAEGVPPAERGVVVVIGDRRAAIESAVRRARHGDVVLVAGKGHETGQEVGESTTPFDDRVELAAAWERVQPHVEPS